MSSRELAAEQIFVEALERDAAARPAFIQEACGADSSLQGRVEALLKAHGQPNSLLDGQRLVATLERPAAENVGQQIGPYKLRELLGEGAWATSSSPNRKSPSAARWR